MTTAGIGIYASLQQLRKSLEIASTGSPSVRSYLAWQAFEFPHQRSPEWPEFFSWLVKQQLDSRWAYFRTTKFNFGGIVQLNTLLESLLLHTPRAFDISYEEYPHLIQLLLEKEKRCGSKVFAPFAIQSDVLLQYRTELGLYSPYAEDILRRIKQRCNINPCIEIVVEFNIPWLVSERMRRFLEASGGQTSASAKDEAIKFVKKWLLESEECHRQVLIVGDLDMDFSKGENLESAEGERPGSPEAESLESANDESLEPANDESLESADDESLETTEHEHQPSIVAVQQFALSRHQRYAVPTKAQSDEILRELDATIHSHRAPERSVLDESFKQAPSDSRVWKLNGLVKEVLETSDESIADVPEWLKRRGHFIPDEGDIDAFKAANCFEERFKVLDELNRKRDTFMEDFAASALVTSILGG